MLAFPLGGVGAGSISLGGRGQLRDWEIFNRPDKGKSPPYAFPSIWARPTNRKPIARVLEARLSPPYEGSSGLGASNVPGLPRLESAKFIGEFPIARIEFSDASLPVKVSLEAFTPFIPHDADESGLPVAILRYRVNNPATSAVKVSIAFSIDNPVGGEGRANEYRKGANIEGLMMRNPFLGSADPLAGSFALCVVGSGNGKVTHLRGWRGGTRWRVGPLYFWDDFSSDGELGPEAPVRDAVGSLCLQREIPPRAQADYTFLLSWHFPNRTPERCGWRAPKGEERTVIGNFYCTRFADAWQAAEYATTKLADLESRTRTFVAAIRESALPAAVRDAAMANLSTLVTPTCFRTADGEFYGFEGCFDQRGCCFGNAVHVWNYEVATDFLFPSLARSMRESSFGFSTDEEGRMEIRKLLPAGKEHFEFAAADGQMGQIIKLYLDWRLTGDTDWLRKMWPAAKRAVEFAWIPGGWDADRDGVMEGAQHTIDVEFFGPYPLGEVWYLGALRAAEEMARAVGDSRAAGEYRRLFLQGSKWTDANLFDGEYYIQKVRGIPRSKIAKGLLSPMGSADTENPEFQLGEGCLIDQLVGQYLAEVAGLGKLLDSANIRKTLQSILKFNSRRVLYDHESVQRIYALNDEAAVIMCHYPEGKRLKNPFPYFAEVMTGFEYQLAVHLLYEGMISEGLQVIEDVRRRYDGERRNPWNEAECGHHYSRAMAAWSAVLALSGFRYHAGDKTLVAVPRISPNSFRCFWSTGTGWGSFSQRIRDKQLRFSLSLAGGTLACRSLELSSFTPAPSKSSASVGNRSLPHELRAGNQILVSFPQDVELKRGDNLTLTLSS